MLTALLFVATLGVAVMLYQTRVELAALRRRLDGLEEGTIAARPKPPEPEIEAPSVRRPAKVLSAGRRATHISAPDAVSVPVTARRTAFPTAGLNFETLVGGKLPIWVGGIALVFSGFFLVRYTIEAGLFGPAARSVTATLFALLMIAISELGGKLPKIGASFAADPRIGQSLAGAGIATLYGTLYMAAEIYGLVGVGTAFILVLLTTAIAFALALRHGPPTALMGLTGGFLAPWVAGMGASNLPILLLYLAVFIAALFGLAIWRRWLWLLVLASGGGLLWSFAMLVAADSSLALLGGFIAATGGGAILAAKRFDQAGDHWFTIGRYAPMAVALVQLALLVPKMEFSLIGWIFYFALSGLAIILAWRDKSLLLMVVAALLVAMLPLGTTWSQDGANISNIMAAIAIILLFGVAGHIRARNSTDISSPWAVIAVAAPITCWFTTVTAHAIDNDNIWAALACLAALPAAWTAWEWHKKQYPATIQPWATAGAAIMLWAAGTLLFAEDWFATCAALVALGVAAWAQVTKGIWERRLSLLPLGIACLVGIAASYQILDAIAASLAGDGAVMSKLPAVGEAMRATFIPAILITAIAWTPVFATGRKTRAIALLLGGAGVTAFGWLLAKQIANIVTPSDFIRLGFAERAVFTHILFAAGWLVLTKAAARPQDPALRTAGFILAGLALFRVVWFDLLLHNPVADPQAVGPVPIANLLTAHFALTAIWLWLLARLVQERAKLGLYGASLGVTIIAVLATIRQAVQGTLVSGANIGTGENYLYSAGLLALSIVWLAVGIRQGSKLLRVAGLLLLTAVTLKVFLVDAAALAGVLRILSFLGLGIALIGIGWAYGRVMRLSDSEPSPTPSTGTN